MRQFLAKSPELIYLTAGGIMAFVMSLLQSGGFTRKNLAVRLSEAVMCSMLSSSITIGSNVWFGWSYELSTPIGAFVGFVGTDFIRALIKGFIIAKTDLEKIKISHEKDKNHDEYK